MSMTRYPISEEEYLIREPEAEYKSEYIDGRAVAMAGASLRHVRIVTNLTVDLGQQVKKGPCEVYGSDMRLHVKAAGLYTYPDLTVVCGEPEMLPGREDTITNPKLIVEVLSKTTERYDRGRKFTHYKKLDSLEEYVLITQDRVCVERFTREKSERWASQQWTSIEDVLELPSIDCRVAVRDVYDRVKF
jgi:Uma2 family endonuclease